MVSSDAWRYSTVWVEKTWDHRWPVDEMIVRQRDIVVGDQLIGGRAEGRSPGDGLALGHTWAEIVRGGPLACSGGRGRREYCVLGRR